MLILDRAKDGLAAYREGEEKSFLILAHTDHKDIAMSKDFTSNDLARFHLELSRLDKRSAVYLTALHGMVCRACKAIIHRKDSQYLTALLEKIHKLDRAHMPQIKRYAVALCGGAMPEKLGLYFDPDLSLIKAISQEKGMVDVVLNSENYAQDNLGRIKDAFQQLAGILFTDLAVKRTQKPQQAVLIRQATELMKKISSTTSNAVRLGKYSKMEQQQLIELLEYLKRVFPGILD